MIPGKALTHLLHSIPIRYEHQAGDGLEQTTTQQHCVVSGVQRRAQLPERRGTRSNKSN